jgi:hypothetical protein
MIPVPQLRLELNRQCDEIPVSKCKKSFRRNGSTQPRRHPGDLSLADGGVGIIWQSIFTPGRYAHIECTNDGAVCGVRTDANCSIDDPNQFRFWWIGELCPENWDPTYTGPGPGELNLTTEEAIEHIRCFIWADYK